MESEVIWLLIPVHTAVTSDVTSGQSFAPGVNCLTSDSVDTTFCCLFLPLSWKLFCCKVHPSDAASTQTSNGDEPVDHMQYAPYFFLGSMFRHTTLAIQPDKLALQTRDLAGLVWLLKLSCIKCNYVKMTRISEYTLVVAFVVFCQLSKETFQEGAMHVWAGIEEGTHHVNKLGEREVVSLVECFSMTFGMTFKVNR